MERSIIFQLNGLEGKFIPRHIVMKFLSTKNIKKIQKASREWMGKKVTYKGTLESKSNGIRFLNSNMG